MIERAGGRPGIWADLPKQMEQKCIDLLMSVKELRGSQLGENTISALLVMSGYKVVESDESEKFLFQKPEISQLVLLVSKLQQKNKWNQVGHLLGIDTKVLERLHMGDSEDSYYAMLKYWLENGASVTWRTLLDAIGHKETKTTMDDIRKMIMENLSPSKSQIPSANPSTSRHHLQFPIHTAASVPQPQKSRMLAPTVNNPQPSSYPDFKRDFTLTSDKIWNLFGKKMYADWKEFAVHLHVESEKFPAILRKNVGFVKECFLEVTDRWLRGEDGTGDRPRTWETLFDALTLTGHPLLVEDVKEAL
jgi:hypothetical protein